MSASGSKSKKSRSAEELIALGRVFAKELKRGDVVCLHGDLGAGKTTFAKGIAAEIASCDPSEVTSPTFVTLQSYGDLHHFDLYRLESSQDFLARGFDEFLGSGICCIEWPERIADLLPESAIHITLEHTEDGREIAFPAGRLCHHSS